MLLPWVVYCLAQQGNNLIPQPVFQAQPTFTARAAFSPVKTSYGNGILSEVTALGTTPTDISLVCPVATAIQRGRLHHFRLWVEITGARTASREGIIGIQLRNRTTKTVAWSSERRCSPDWSRLQVAFRPTEDIPIRDAELLFTLGYRPQNVRLAGLELVSFGPDEEPANLTSTLVSYLGRSERATWRSTALARIQKTRQTTVKLSLRDRNGKPLAGQKLTAKLVQPAFQWSVAPSAPDFGPNWFSSKGLLAEGALDEGRVDSLLGQLANQKDANPEFQGLVEEWTTGDAFIEPQAAFDNLDRLRGIGVSCQVTQFSVRNEDGSFARDALRDALIVAYSHPAVRGFQVDSGFLDRNPDAKRVWTTWVDKTWNASVSTTTDARGTVALQLPQGLVEVGVGAWTKRLEVGKRPLDLTWVRQ